MMIAQDTNVINDSHFDRLYNKDFMFDVHDINNFLRLPNGRLQANVAFRPRYSERWSTKNNYLFVSGERSPHELDSSCKYYHQELQPGPKGEDEAMDKEWRVYNRKEVKIMNAYLLILGSEIEYRAKNVDSETSWDFPGFYKVLSEWLNHSGFYNRVFSPYAGCSMCKCSSGFKLKNVHSSIRNVAMYVTFKEYTNESN
ncbi:hypothetical protein EBR43_05625 [bacterium]|nr:hypothetical protein [bacterium]